MKKVKLLLIRKKKGVTQQQLADLIATDVSNYSRKESGDVKIRPDEWEKIARFLDVSLEEIFEDDNYFLDYENKYDEKARAYIEKLERENAALREKLEQIKLIIK